MSVRYVTAVPRKAATGQVAEVYAQSAADFGQAAFAMLSPAPDIHAATWAVLRESELVGQAPRANKEVVAVAVSVANGCRFCMDAHTIMIHATGEHQLGEDVLHGRTPADPEHAKLIAWAQATATTGMSQMSVPPGPAELAGEYIGTALSTHFANRMFSALTDEKLLPGSLQRSASVRRAAGMAFTRTVRRQLTPAASLDLLGGAPMGSAPEWAAGTPMATAFAALRGATAAGGVLLTETSRELLSATVAAGDCGFDQQLAGLPEADRPAARLALLAAVAPHRITDADVAAWRTANDATDADLVRLLSFGAITAVNRIEKAIATPAETGRT